MKTFGVIGLGSFGYYAAKELFRAGHEVIAIDSQRSKVQAVREFTTEALHLNATDKESLAEVLSRRVEGVVVATGEKISNSILICSYLVDLEVPEIIVKAIDEDHGKILRKLGAHQVVFPEKESATRIAKALSSPNLIDFLPLSGELELQQIECPESFVGKSLRELNLRAHFGVHVVGLSEAHTTEFDLIPAAEYELQAKSTLIVIGKVGDLNKIRALG